VEPDGEIVRFEALADPEAVARTAAAFTAGEARAAVAARGRFVMAVSGGRTPWIMLRALADQPVPWADVHIVQVDERVAPAGHPDRNLTHLRDSLLAHCPLRPEQVHAMPVESANLEAASEQYATTLKDVAGAPVVLDLVLLGLGPDGHTASLVPGDPALGVTETDVAVTGVYQGRRRMTLTYPILNRARRIAWLVTGREKAEMLARLNGGDRSIPAGRIRQDRAVVLADSAASAGYGGPRAPDPVEYQAPSRSAEGVVLDRGREP
jgi:6-phosphogluconolactonase